MIFNTVAASSGGGGGSSEWTVLDFPTIFDGSSLVSVDGTYLTNGQLVYVSIPQVNISDMVFASASNPYAPITTAFGSGFSPNDGLPVTVLFENGNASAIVSDGNSPAGDIAFTILYPIA